MKKIITICMAVIAGAFPHSAFAAQILFEPESFPVPQVNPYVVTVMFDTEGESINAIEGTVSIDASLGDVQSVTDSGSIITYWVGRPEWKAGTHAVTFSGAVPTGFTGKGILFSIVLPAYTGSRIAKPLQFSGVKALRNDGLGSSARITSGEFSFGESVAPDSSVNDQLYLDESKIDNIPPEIFSPQISRDDRVAGGKWFVSFATTDKQSGIDHYELQEVRSGKIDAGKWKQAESPYILEDQELHSFVYIIAIDRQGNERVIKIFPRRPISWFQQWGSGIAALSGIVITGVLTYIITKRRRRQNIL